MIGGYRVDELLRRLRRTADLSQRDLARHAGIAPGTVAKYETGALTPSLTVLQRLLDAAAYLLVVVDHEGRLVPPLEVWDGVADLAGRRFPPHLDTILDPEFGEWWADGFGLVRPPETFRRNRAYRDWQRRRSRWEVRVKQLRFEPIPRLWRGYRDGDEWRTDEATLGPAS